jgi:FkbM family methyltransferase
MSLSLRTASIRLACRFLGAYDRLAPVQRGKHWLRRRAVGFAVAPIGSGLYIRVSGLSGFESKAYRGERAEPLTTAAWQKMLRPGMTVLNVGANVGYFALIATNLVGLNSHVLAFEATPSVAARLSENVFINNLANVTVNVAAVTDHDGEIEFRLTPDDSEGNSLVRFDSDWRRITVPAISIDTYVAKNNLTRVNVLKIDVEGAEESVIAGARTLLSGPNPPVVFR